MKIIKIVSSPEPNGMTWLINCLMELGYCCFPGEDLNKSWIKDDVKNTYQQSKLIDQYERWLPNLRNKDSRAFKKNIAFSWGHEWPFEHNLNEKVIIFVRNPKSSILSNFRRQNLRHIDYNQYVKLINPYSLISIPEHLNLFYESWFEHGKKIIVKFEDAKLNPYRTLKEILEFIGIEVDSNSIERSVAASTSQKAQESEIEYLKRNKYPLSHRVSRLGSTNEWQNPNILMANEYIDERTYSMQRKLNYIERKNTEPKNIFYFANFLSNNKIMYKNSIPTCDLNQLISVKNTFTKYENYKNLHKIEYLGPKNLLGMIRKIISLKNFPRWKNLAIIIYLLKLITLYPFLLAWANRSKLLKYKLFRKLNHFSKTFL